MQIRLDLPQLVLNGGTCHDLTGKQDVPAVGAEEQLPAVHAGAGEVADDGAAAVLPVAADGKILMVRQYRNALNRFTLEIPAGKLDAPDEPKVLCAFRELEEETGFRVESPDSLEYLMSLTTTVAFCDEAIDIFVAHNLIPSHQNLDEDEVINVEPCELADLEEMVYTGKITDGKTIAAIMAYARKYRSVDKKDDLA